MPKLSQGEWYLVEKTTDGEGYFVDSWTGFCIVNVTFVHETWSPCDATRLDVYLVPGLKPRKDYRPQMEVQPNMKPLSGKEEAMKILEEKYAEYLAKSTLEERKNEGKISQKVFDDLNSFLGKVLSLTDKSDPFGLYTRVQENVECLFEDRPADDWNDGEGLQDGQDLGCFTDYEKKVLSVVLLNTMSTEDYILPKKGKSGHGDKDVYSIVYDAASRIMEDEDELDDCLASCPEVLEDIEALPVCIVDISKGDPSAWPYGVVVDKTAKDFKDWACYNCG